MRTTNSNHSHPVFSNLIQDLLITSINQVWVSDITYIRLPTAFVYLAVILDLYSRRGNPYENAVCESFIKTLKDEEVYLWEYKTMEDAERRICHFIKDVYNEKRLHSSLGYCPLNEFEERSLDKQKPTVPS